MEDQQKQSSDKIFDELPTFAAPAVPAGAGSGGDQASVYDLNDNFSIFKVGGDQPQQQQEPQTATKEESILEKELDFSNPDTFVIGKPSVGHFVDLDFSLDPLASIDTTSAPKAGTTQANFLDDLDDWSTEEKQPTSAEPTKTTAAPAASVGAGGDSNLVNVTNLMDTSCIDNLLSDLPEETDEEDELSNRSAKNDSDWYASGMKPGLTFQEEIITTSSVVFEASQPESVTLLPDQHSFSLGGDDISSGSSLRTSNEEKDMSFSESSFMKEELKSTDEITTTTHTSESPVQPQPSSPVLAASESALPKSAPKGRPSQPPPPPPPVLSSSSSSSSDLGITSGVPQQSSPAPVEGSLTLSGIPAADAADDDIITSTSSSSQAAGLEKAETTISSTSDTGSFLGSAAPPVAIETTAALPPLPLSPPSISSWSPSSSSAATAAPTADLVANTTAARQASIDDDDDEVPVQTSISSSSSSSYHPQDEQPTSAETIFSAGRDFAPPSAAPFSSASSSDLLPSQSSSADLIKEEEVIKTESEPVKSTWSPPPPPPPSSPPVSQVVKEVPSTTAQEVKKVPVEVPKQQQQQTTSIMGRKNRRDNSADDGAEQATGSDQVKEYIENVLGPNVAELVYWRDLKNSGAVFGLGLVILFSLSIFSVISVVAYTLFFSLLASLSFRIYKNVMQAVQKTGEGHPFKEYLEIQITPSQERIHEIVESAIIHGTFFVNRLRSVLLVEDIVDSLKYLVIFWAFTYIGAWFNGLTVIILLYLGAFSLPLVYEQNRGQIDQYLELANAKFAEVADKIPFLKKASAVPAEKKEE